MNTGKKVTPKRKPAKAKGVFADDGLPKNAIPISQSFLEQSQKEHEERFAKERKYQDDKEEKQQKMIIEAVSSGLDKIIGHAKDLEELKQQNPKKSITMGNVKIKCDSLTISF